MQPSTATNSSPTMTNQRTVFGWLIPGRLRSMMSRATESVAVLAGASVLISPSMHCPKQIY
jgi:hypothetical protein